MYGSDSEATITMGGQTATSKDFESHIRSVASFLILYASKTEVFRLGFTKKS